MKSVIKIGLAEDHGALRQGYVTLLKEQKNIEVLFDVSNGKELLEKLKISRPNILLLDLEMPVMNGPRVLEIIKYKYPSIRVVIVSAYFTKSHIVECFKLGAKAFLKKQYEIEKIVEAINTTFEHGACVDNEVACILANEMSNLGTAKKRDLTDHQIEVLILICKGHTNKEAADELKITTAAIKYHRGNIMQKTGSKSLQDLISYAQANKYI